MANGSYLPLGAVVTAPFGRTIKLRQCGQVVDITGWSATATLSDYPGGPQRLALSTAAPTANGSSLQVVSAPLVDCYGNPVLDYTGAQIIISALNWVISPADLAALPVNPATGQPGDPTVFAHAVQMTDLMPFTRRWLYGPFSVSQG